MSARHRQETINIDASELQPDAMPRSVLSDTESALPAFDASIDDLLPHPPVVDRTVSLGGNEGVDLPRDPRLVVLAGAHETDVLTLPRDRPFVIGRLDTCDLVLDDEGVSRRHAQFTVTESGTVLEDLDSRNGTFVGNQPITRHLLSPDEIVRVGTQTVIKYALMDQLEEDYQRRLLQAALRDGLTGLYNRRHFDERLTAEAAACRRHGRPLSLAILDLDNFKRLNDTYGHSMGDEALRQVGQVLAANARKEDTVFRFGGEEFCILFRETALDGATQATERRRELIRKLKLKAGESDLIVTVSAGVTEWQIGDSETTLLERADRALYEAKRLGKNRVRAK